MPKWNSYKIPCTQGQMNGVIGLETSRTRIIKVTDLNPHLMCVLCGGYYIDATTIIECLHSFCKTCIVRYLETSKFCPICDVQVHKTKPLLNIRSDQTLQDIVYKLVPGLYQREMKRRREFYAKQPPEVLKIHPPKSNEERGNVDSDFPHNIFSPNEFISVALEYSETCGIANRSDQDDKSKNARRRYLRCPVQVTVAHIRKLIKAKYGLSVNQRVDIMCSRDCLGDEFTLLDIAYISAWKRRGPLKLYYRICEQPYKRLKTFHTSPLLTPTIESDCKEPSDIPKQECKNDVVQFSGEAQVEETKSTCEETVEIARDGVPSTAPETPSKEKPSCKDACDTAPVELVNGQPLATDKLVNNNNDDVSEINGRKAKVKNEDILREEKKCSIIVVRENLDVLSKCKSTETNLQQQVAEIRLNGDVIPEDKHALSEKVNGITVNGKDNVSVREIRLT